MKKNIQDAVEILRQAGDSVFLDVEDLDGPPDYGTLEIIIHAMYHVQRGEGR